MSSPNSDREMLLSAALDGELNVQEQAEFDRLISNDPTFAAEFDELQALRANIRSCFSELRGQTLPAGATQRIVAAAMAEADRLHEPTRPQSDAGQISRPTKTKWIATVLALAASVLVVIGVWSRGKTQPTTLPNLIAQVDPEKSGAEKLASEKSDTALPQDSETPLVAVAPVAAPTPESTVNGVTELTRETQPMASDVESIAAVSAATPDSRPKVMGIKSNSPATDDKFANKTTEPAMVVDATKPAVEREPLNVVMVFSVELTPSGRDADAVAAALAASGIRLEEKSDIGAAVVSQLKMASVIKATAETAGDESSKLYFIEASGKQLDRFMMSVLSDAHSFNGIGMTLALDPPLLAAVGDLREIDPTKVRQDAPSGIARGLVAADGATWSTDTFVPLTRDGAADSGVMQSASTGEDFPSQLLLLVK